MSRRGKHEDESHGSQSKRCEILRHDRQAGFGVRCLTRALKGEKQKKKDQKNLQSEVMGSVSELCVSSFQAFLCPTIPRSPPGKSWLIFHGVNHN